MPKVISEFTSRKPHWLNGSVLVLIYALTFKLE